jgi:diamine N-acetyltransferase
MSKRPMSVLQGEKIRLRPLAREDLPLTLSWRNQDAVRQWFFHSGIISSEQHYAWYEEYCERDDDFIFIIEETDILQLPVGQVALYHVDWLARRAEFGRLMIGEPRARGKGLAKAATQLMLEYAVSELQLCEIYLEVYETNMPALAVYRACGFTETRRCNGIVTMTWKAPRYPD